MNEEHRDFSTKASAIRRGGRKEHGLFRQRALRAVMK